MGCNNSSLNKSGRTSKDGGSGDISNSPNPLTDREIEMRMDAAPHTHQVTISGIDMRFAWVSQRGYYPDAPDKENQDAFIIMPSFGKKNANNQAFFAVFDGHGKDGHHCARYVRDHLPKNLVDVLDQNIPPGSAPSHQIIENALVTAHLSTNEFLHSDKRFDTALSGTTSISVYFRNHTMYISNVGDSRAVLVSETAPTADGNSSGSGGGSGGGGRYVAIPLSVDQTPYRKDERERIKATGARVLSMEQIEGAAPVHENWGDLVLGEEIDEGGDPPRVWSRNGDYPGTAFTRSMGDRIAEECGVMALPEILERKITPADKFLIIASDGVFEFLTNHMVADILVQHADPLAACKAVVAAAYNMWLQYEVRTDDITIICIYIDAVPGAGGFGTSSSFYTGNNTPPPTIAAAVVAQSDGADHSPVPPAGKKMLGVQIPVAPSRDSTDVKSAGNSPKLSPTSRTTTPSVNGESQLHLNNSWLSNGTGGGGGSGSTPRVAIGSAGGSVDEAAERALVTSISHSAASLELMAGSKPVRRVMSREKRKHIIQLQEQQDALLSGSLEDAKGEITEEEMAGLMVPKSDEDVAAITSAIKANFLFQHLSAAQRSIVVGVMEEVSVKAGDRVIRQGDRGDRFYVVCEGRFEVRVKPSASLTSAAGAQIGKGGTTEDMLQVSNHGGGGSGKGGSLKRVLTLTAERVPSAATIEQEQDPDSLGNAVHVYESGPNQHPGFGELSLMYSKPRAASVIALTDGKLWALDRRIFQRVVLRPKNFRKRILKTLRRVPVLRSLTLTQLQRLADLLNETTYSAGETILSSDASANAPQSSPGGGAASAAKGRSGSLGSSEDGGEGADEEGFFYLIVRGRCKCIIQNPREEDTLRATVAFNTTDTAVSSAEAGEMTTSAAAESTDSKMTQPEEAMVVDSLEENKLVIRYKENDYFGEEALLGNEERSPAVGASRPSTQRSVTVVAETNMKVLLISRRAFEAVLGPLEQIMDTDRKRREALAIADQCAPHSITEMTLQGVISSDPLGPMLLGSFHCPEPNICVRTFLLSEVERKGLDDSVVRFIDATKAVLAGDADMFFNRSVLVPKLLSFIMEPNALHVVFDAPVVADLGTLIRDHSDAFIASKSDCTMYTFACVVCALERLHSLDIIYRAVQPESLYVDALGRVVLLDFRVCKIGLAHPTGKNSAGTTVQSGGSSGGSTTTTTYINSHNSSAGGVIGGSISAIRDNIGANSTSSNSGSNQNNLSRTFTMCGASDYLAPEQISQVGHSYPVDLWSLGVLLYELSVGSHPFSSSSEVATYSKITSFGTKAFPALTFPDHTAPEVRLLINQLLMPTPEARIGAGSSGFAALKVHPYLKSFTEWSALNSGMYPSPLLDMALQEREAMLAEGLQVEGAAEAIAACSTLYKGHEERAQKWAELTNL